MVYFACKLSRLQLPYDRVVHVCCMLLGPEPHVQQKPLCRLGHYRRTQPASSSACPPCYRGTLGLQALLSMAMAAACMLEGTQSPGFQGTRSEGYLPQERQLSKAGALAHPRKLLVLLVGHREAALLNHIKRLACTGSPSVRMPGLFTSV